MGFINALIHYLTCVTRREKGTTMDLWQQVLIETKNKSKMHQGLADNVSTDIVNRFMIISDDCKRISKHVRVYNYLNPLTESVISTLFLPAISLLNHTLRSWEYRKWSLLIITPWQHHRKCEENSMDICTDIRVHWVVKWKNRYVLFLDLYDVNSCPLKETCM